MVQASNAEEGLLLCCVMISVNLVEKYSFVS